MKGPAKNLLGAWWYGRGGGILPGTRTTYPRPIAEALHALAESRPTPEGYARERARILAATK